MITISWKIRIRNPNPNPAEIQGPNSWKQNLKRARRILKKSEAMEKGKGVMGGRRWAVDLTDYSTTPSSRDIPDPPGFSRASLDQVPSSSSSAFFLLLFFFNYNFYIFIHLVDFVQDDSTLSRQKKDAEANWKAQVILFWPNCWPCLIYVTVSVIVLYPFWIVWYSFLINLLNFSQFGSIFLNYSPNFPSNQCQVVFKKC